MHNMLYLGDAEDTISPLLLRFTIVSNSEFILRL